MTILATLAVLLGATLAAAVLGVLLAPDHSENVDGF